MKKVEKIIAFFLFFFYIIIVEMVMSSMKWSLASVKGEEPLADYG